MGCVSSQDTKGNGSLLPKEPKEVPQNKGDSAPTSEPNHVSGVDQYLTPEQQLCLKETWTVMAEKDMYDLGGKIFIQIFTLAPATKEIFHFGDQTNEALLVNTKFRIHSTRFMKVVERTIENLDHLDVVLTPLLFQLGRTHDSPDKPDNFADFLHCFVTAMDNTWAVELGDRYDAKTQESWLCLFNLIANKVREGFVRSREDRGHPLTGGVATDTNHTHIEQKSNGGTKDDNHI